MHYSPTLLAKAFLASAKETEKNKHAVITQRFIKVAAKYGGQDYLLKTLKEIERLNRKEHGDKNISLHTARPLSKKLMVSVSSLFKKTDKMQAKIDPTLIAGIKIVIDDELSIDNTLKRKLQKLFS